jgi:hypothetical protein
VCDVHDLRSRRGVGEGVKSVWGGRAGVTVPDAGVDRAAELDRGRSTVLGVGVGRSLGELGAGVSVDDAEGAVMMENVGASE